MSVWCQQQTFHALFFFGSCDYIGAIPLFPMTSDHFKISDAMKFLRSSGPRSIGSAPCSAKSARTFGSFVASFAEAYNLSTRAVSILAGASNASHAYLSQ